MDKHTASEVIACLQQERRVFRYFKDRYAFMLLARAIGNSVKVRELRKTAFGRLLAKPVVRETLARCGNGTLTPAVLNDVWCEPSTPFVLTLDVWGCKDQSWDQTTRGGYNLVLQLNFSNKHDAAYRRLLKPVQDGALNFEWHPIFRRRDERRFRETLAWARIDIELDTDEALIEEIQSDWVVSARFVREEVERCQAGHERDYRPYSGNGALQGVKTYLYEVLTRYERIWAEAMLMASIAFIHDELGIRHIYYHSYETGVALKRIRLGKPPRSLYTRLPRQFCFSETDIAPLFLKANTPYRRVARKLKQTRWFKLELRENIL